MPKPLQVKQGDRYGLLSMIGAAPNGPRGRRFLFRCDCGTEKTLHLIDVRHGGTQSCGCHRVEISKISRPPVRVKHGLAKRGCSDVLYTCWEHIKSRCFNTNDPYYHSYGGRGITLHSAWVNDPAAFAHYIQEHIGPRPAGHSIDRIDNDGSYEPGNLKWSTTKQQSLNTRRNRRITAFGECLTISEWAHKTGIDSMTIHCRIKRGWSSERALGR